MPAQLSLYYFSVFASLQGNTVIRQGMKPQFEENCNPVVQQWRVGGFCEDVYYTALFTPGNNKWT